MVKYTAEEVRKMMPSYGGKVERDKLLELLYSCITERAKQDFDFAIVSFPSHVYSDKVCVAAQNFLEKDGFAVKCFRSSDSRNIFFNIVWDTD